MATLHNMGAKGTENGIFIYSANIGYHKSVCPNPKQHS